MKLLLSLLGIVAAAPVALAADWAVLGQQPRLANSHSSGQDPQLQSRADHTVRVTAAACTPWIGAVAQWRMVCHRWSKEGATTTRSTARQRRLTAPC